MMTENPVNSFSAVRVTLVVHQSLINKATDVFKSLGINALFLENSRCVRQKLSRRFLGLPGVKVEYSDSPAEIFRIFVSEESAHGVLCRLIKELELRTPGRGAAYSQKVKGIGNVSVFNGEALPVGNEIMNGDFSLITGIQSKSASGENLAKVAIKLGAGVPVVSFGTGTGIRDRLGLLRITISPEKEFVHLLVPVHDANGLQRLLIEEGHLDRPGGGFLYQTPVIEGLADPLIRIGRQESAASIEQIIAAIDDLKRSTAWRKRFFGMEENVSRKKAEHYTHREIVFMCQEGQGDILVKVAMENGAEGATISRLRVHFLQDNVDNRSIPFEHGVLCVAASQEHKVFDRLAEISKGFTDQKWLVLSTNASSVFSHKR